jgi:DNA-binding NtrC family response regulator
MLTGRTLFAFVDLKDPYMLTGVAGEQRPGPILSILDAQPFNTVVLFYTPETRAHAMRTWAALGARAERYHVVKRELPVSDPRDYPAIMGALTPHVIELAGDGETQNNFVNASGGTAEMRAAWYFLAATGMLRARLLHVAPQGTLYGPADVSEVPIDELRRPSRARDFGVLFSRSYSRAEPSYAEAAPAPPRREDELDAALRELGIFIGSAVSRLEAERAATAAPTSLPVLILGETGTGKERFARLIHRLSPRRGTNMVTVNCGGIPHELVESFLFGHRKGAFTGAISNQQGKFVIADDGTLFLDEIGELPLAAQAKLLRVLQGGEVEPVGAHQSTRVDVRIIAATNRDLRAEVAAGRFREDLYFRLETVTLKLPPLRERRSEIVPLALALLEHINKQTPRPRMLSRTALRRLEQHDWPGNVRELENVLQRSVLFAPADVLEPEHVIITGAKPTADLFAAIPDPAPGFNIEQFLAKIRHHLFTRALASTDGNQAAAAELLGVSRQAVNNFVKGNGG